ncbi:MAG: YjjG family noncanonical pyrimidine nucleotidase [Prevotellaceae bacterium]|nr:YjjG family noncanonical pyrimidine nucleotidase [Prevotellaceae bacterium]
MTDMRRYCDLFIDLDDTILDTRGNSELAMREVFGHYGLERYFGSFEAFNQPYWRENVMLWTDYAAGRISRDYLIVERFRRPLSLGKGLEVTPELCLEMSDFFLRACSTKGGVIKDAHKVLGYLRARGYRLHVCSNGFHEVQYKKMEAAGLRDYFQSVVLSEDAGANKPAWEFFDYALRQAGASKETTLMIGDNFVTDMEGARKAGLDVMFFNQHPDEFTAPAPVNYEIHALGEIMRIL